MLCFCCFRGSRDAVWLHGDVLIAFLAVSTNAERCCQRAHFNGILSVDFKPEKGQSGVVPPAAACLFVLQLQETLPPSLLSKHPQQLETL